MAEEKKAYGQMLVSKNEDGTAVVEFEGLVTSNVPLETDSQDFAGAINELSKKLQQGGGGDEPIEDWQPPAHWLTVPDPAANEIYVLVEVIDDTLTNFVNFTNGLAKPENGWGGMGSVSVDWGDGESYTYSEAAWIHDELKHTYTTMGQYLIKITTEIGENNVFMAFRNGEGTSSAGRSNVLICKTGADIVLSYNGYVSYGLLFGTKIQYFKHLGSAESLPRYFANAWSGLVKAEFGEPIKNVPYSAFYGCSALRILDTSEVISIGESAFYGTPGFISSFPKCVEIGAGTFQNTYLSKISIPECEILGNNALQGSRIIKISIPKCKSIGAYALANCLLLESADISACETLGNGAFSGDYNLSNITVSTDCNFGNNCFQNCRSLYPRPDGSAN